MTLADASSDTGALISLFAQFIVNLNVCIVNLLFIYIYSIQYQYGCIKRCNCSLIRCFNRLGTYINVLLAAAPKCVARPSSRQNIA